MKIVTRYLVREVAVSAGLGLLLFTFVIFMDRIARLLQAVIHTNSGAILKLVLDALPLALVFTVPMAVLVGLMIALGRLAADGELIALRACGLGGQQIVRPLLWFSVGCTALSLVFTLWLGPLAGRRALAMEGDLRLAPALLDMQPQVFFETIPKVVLYAGGHAPNGGWKNIFIADNRNPVNQEIVMAARGAMLNRGGGLVQFHLEDGIDYQLNPARPGHSLVSSFVSTDIPFQLPVPRRRTPPLEFQTTGALWRQAGFGIWGSSAAADWRLARVEFYRRLALSIACLALALLGLPLALPARRGSKSGGFVFTLGLIFLYYIIFYLGLALARQGRGAPFLGVWAANLIFLGVGVWRLSRVDRVPRRASNALDPVTSLRVWLTQRFGWLESPEYSRGALVSWPSLVDGYVIREFLGYVGLLLATFLLLVLLVTFFDLFGDILRTHTPITTVLAYLLYLSPQMLYRTIPVAMLVAVLVSFGLMSKFNEITALKACGVSIYRLIIPVLSVAVILCALQFALDATWLPLFNRRQDALRNFIKGHPAATFQQPERKWMFGRGRDIYYFRYYRYASPASATFADITILSYNPATFHLTRRLYAKAARWDPLVHGWVFENGWRSRIEHGVVTRFEPFLIASFPRFKEPPAYFKAGAPQGTQMTYWALRQYVAKLQRSGYDVSPLRVQLNKKLAYPLMTIIMALLAFPFALTVGKRGTVAGIAVAIGVAIVYWVSAGFLQALGNLDQLPPALAAWIPTLAFAILAVYLLLRVPA